MCEVGCIGVPIGVSCSQRVGGHVCWMLGKGSAPLRKLEEQDKVLLVTHCSLIYGR